MVFTMFWLFVGASVLIIFINKSLTEYQKAKRFVFCMLGLLAFALSCHVSSQEQYFDTRPPIHHPQYSYQYLSPVIGEMTNNTITYCKKAAEKNNTITSGLDFDDTSNQGRCYMGESTQNLIPHEITHTQHFPKITPKNFEGRPFNLGTIREWCDTRLRTVNGVTAHPDPAMLTESTKVLVRCFSPDTSVIQVWFNYTITPVIKTNKTCSQGENTPAGCLVNTQQTHDFQRDLAVIAASTECPSTHPVYKENEDVCITEFASNGGSIVGQVIEATESQTVQNTSLLSIALITLASMGLGMTTLIRMLKK